MTDLNLEQIQSRLNELFVTYGERKLIFWFDPKREFEEEIDNNHICFDNVKIYKLEPHNQIKAKYHFEIEDTVNSYLIYAPFKKINDDDPNNHLLSLLKYSNQFSADRLAIVMEQLDIKPDLHEEMEKYAKFFEAKSRINTFKKYSSTGINSKEELETVLMAVLTKANVPQFSYVIKALITDYNNDSESLYNQLVSYSLDQVFWKYVANYYGYTSDQPTIQKLIISLYTNAFYSQLGYQALPTSLKEYEVLDQTTAIVSLMDSFMNDARYTEVFDKLSEDIYALINGEKLIKKVPIEELIGADIFEVIHEEVIAYYIEQLLNEDINPRVSGRYLSDVLIDRERAHFGNKFHHYYQAILNAQQLMNYVFTTNMNDFSLIVSDYENLSYMMDQYYRKFIWHYDQIPKQDKFNELFIKVEKYYKTYLDDFSRIWNESLSLDERPSILDFYDEFAKNGTKTVVIISDALRYEVAKEIQVKIEQGKKYTTNMRTVFSVLPSVTEFGKAASLKGKNEPYEYIQGTDVRVNGMKTQGTQARNKILQGKNKNAIAITYEEIMSKSNAKELREVFNGQEVIYIYHDLIDKTGDHGQETQVFEAVDKTISEIKSLIPFISNGANVYRFIITSDHGFIYSRSRIEEYEKIENPSISDEDRVERRFIISNQHYQEIGIKSMKLGDVLRNDDERYIHYPVTTSIFKKAGGGQNYVHGGSSPQEVIIPVLEINVSRGSSHKEQATIQLMTTKTKIIGLSVSLEFYQTAPISDSVIKSQYSLYFEDEKGNRLSNENIYYADSSAEASSERFSTFTFDFISRNYDTDEKVLLIMKDAKTKVELERKEFTIDNPFAGSFGFDI